MPVVLVKIWTRKEKLLRSSVLCLYFNCYYEITCLHQDALDLISFYITLKFDRKPKVLLGWSSQTWDEMPLASSCCDEHIFSALMKSNRKTINSRTIAGFCVRKTFRLIKLKMMVPSGQACILANMSRSVHWSPLDSGKAISAYRSAEVVGTRFKRATEENRWIKHCDKCWFGSTMWLLSMMVALLYTQTVNVNLL